MALTDVEHTLNQLNDQIEVYRQISETDIPKTLKEANDRKWELAVTSIQLPFLTHYALEQQDIDSRRVVKLETALRLIEEYEEDLIQEHIRDTNQILWSKLATLGFVTQFIWNNFGLLWDGIVYLFKSGTITEAFLKILSLIGSFFDPFGDVADETIRAIYNAVSVITGRIGSLILGALLGASAIAVFNIAAKDVISRRDKSAAALRKKALPQRNGKRYVRRKVHRI